MGSQRVKHDRVSTHDEYDVVSHNKPCSFKCAAFYMAFFCFCELRVRWRVVHIG